MLSSHGSCRCRKHSHTKLYPNKLFFAISFPPRNWIRFKLCNAKTFTRKTLRHSIMFRLELQPRTLIYSKSNVELAFTFSFITIWMSRRKFPLLLLFFCSQEPFQFVEHLFATGVTLSNYTTQNRKQKKKKIWSESPFEVFPRALSNYPP